MKVGHTVADLRCFDIYVRVGTTSLVFGDGDDDDDNDDGDLITHNIIFEVVTEMNLKISVLWDVTPYFLVDGYQRFGARNFLRKFGTHLTNTRGQIP